DYYCATNYGSGINWQFVF
nr:immunoglobulin light chain junction region [Macaca mulatta]MOW60959.1 immunoglobulin light chain junction region [Macaca mulatta]